MKILKWIGASTDYHYPEACLGIRNPTGSCSQAGPVQLRCPYCYLQSQKFQQHPVRQIRFVPRELPIKMRYAVRVDLDGLMLSVIPSSELKHCRSFGIWLLRSSQHCASFPDSGCCLVILQHHQQGHDKCQRESDILVIEYGKMVAWDLQASFDEARIVHLPSQVWPVPDEIDVVGLRLGVKMYRISCAYEYCRRQS